MTGSFLGTVVAALRVDDRPVVHLPADNGHGDPESWRLSWPVDRAAVERRFDLGPLARWMFGPDGQWVLVDDLTHASLHGSGASPPHDGPGPIEGFRMPLAHVGAYPELRRRWATPTAAEELGVLDGRPLDVRGPHLTRRVEADGTPEAMLGRVREVLAVVLGRLTDTSRISEVAGSLPDWFVAACAPRRTSREWAEWAEQAYDDPSSIRRRRREAHWTVETWLRAMVPAERTWWLCRAAVEDGSARLTVLTPGHRAPTSALSWLLHVAGATDCRSAETALAPLVLPALPTQRRRDPDDELAAAAHELLGLSDPLVLEPVVTGSSSRWEHRIDVPIDIAALDRDLVADSLVRWGSDARSSWITNGWSTVVGPPVPRSGGERGSRLSWRERWRRAWCDAHVGD